MLILVAGGKQGYAPCKMTCFNKFFFTAVKFYGIKKTATNLATFIFLVCHQMYGIGVLFLFACCLHFVVVANDMFLWSHVGVVECHVLSRK